MRLTRNTRFSRFQETISFKTTATQYTTFEVTLQPVAGGTARTVGVDDSAFPPVK